jgi:multidrug efflux pump subunit AcrB
MSSPSAASPLRWGAWWTTPSWSWKISTAIVALADKPRRNAVLDAAREVAMPIFVSTITTIVVFLPTVFLEGQARLLFIPLTFTISCSLFASFLVSRTVTPLLCFHWLRPPTPPPPGTRNPLTLVLAWSSRRLEQLDAVYQRAITWALSHRKMVIGGVVAALLSALALVPLIGTEFFPPSDESQFIIRCALRWGPASRRPSGSSRRWRDCSRTR